MKNKVKNLSQNKKMQNFSFLTIAQAANYILPLLAFPYLIRVVGIDNFGIIMFVLATIQFLKIISDYGFTLIAVKDIAQNKNNILLLNEITSNVLSTKLLLLLISSILLISSLSIFGKLESIEIYIFAILVVLGESLFPNWFFQGLEDMKYIAILQFVSKLVFIILILILINSKEDYIYVLLYQAIGTLLMAFIGLYLLRKKYNINLELPKISKIIYYLIEGWHLFISTFFVKIYNSTNIIILGFLVSNSMVGYYALAEKVVLAFSSLIGSPLNQTIYPHLSRLGNNFDELKISVKKFASILFVIGLLSSLFVFIFAKYIILILSGEENQYVITLLQIMSLSIIFFPFGGFFTQILIILKENKLVMKTTIQTAIAHYIIFIPFAYYFEAMGVACTLLIVRIIHTLIHLYYYNKLVLTK